MDLDVRMKLYEGIEAQRILMPRLPVLARMDGICFHSFTKGFKRPYDENLSNAMINTTRLLVEEFGANCGYTQSDEITLGWGFEDTPAETQMYAGGRVQKLATHLAAKTSLKFAQCIASDAMPIEKVFDKLKGFDARVWNAPSPAEASNAFLWREQDATKNSIQMAARSVYSHKECDNKNGSDLQEMLWKKGINWNDYPDFFKRGTYFVKKRKQTKFTTEEIDKLPLMHQARKNPDLMIERVVYEKSSPQLASMSMQDRVSFLFGS